MVHSSQRFVLFVSESTHSVHAQVASTVVSVLMHRVHTELLK